VEIDRLRSGKASVLSNNPFVGLQTACHARLLDSQANIFLTRFDFESAAASILYEPHKVAMSMACAPSYTVLCRDIFGWAPLFRF
jgi:hypothetical protein